MPPESGKPGAQTLWAAERTLLAWLRTSISLLAFGFVVARFDLFLHRQPQTAGSLVGAGLTGLGGLFAVLAVARYRQEVSGHVSRGPKPWLGVAAGLAVAMAAAVVTGYLLSHHLTL
jgi:putative membrane protein